MVYIDTVIVVTSNEVPGSTIVQVIGPVYGLTVRARNIFSSWGSGLKAIVGGELSGVTKLLYEGRKEALDRLIWEASQMGANAIIAFRFETTEYSTFGTEFCAYGTAVKIS